jgi:hypothetical protein
VSGYRLVAEPAVDLDVEAASDWYQNERAGLGLEFLAPSKDRSSTSSSGQGFGGRWSVVAHTLSTSPSRPTSSSFSRSCMRIETQRSGKRDEANTALARRR